MRITFDTNVILDNLLDRGDFADTSTRVLELARVGKIAGFITANTITDIYYIVMKSIRDDQKARLILQKMLVSFDIIDVSSRDIQKALFSPMVDFEDALLAACAHRIKSDLIVTRNQDDFVDSPVVAITPEAFLKQWMGTDILT